MEKMTNVKAIAYVLDNVADVLPEDVIEKLTAIKVTFEKKSANKKPTKTQTENVSYKEIIKAVLTTEGKTVTELQALDSTLASLSNQRVSALLRQMVEAGEVVKTIDKKKSFFALA